MMQLLFGNRKFYGRYSFKEYYEQFHVFNTLKDLMNLLDREPEENIVSQIAINFNVIAFGDSIKEIRRMMGRPLHRIDNSEHIRGHEKLYYRLNFGAFTAMAQMHFLNDTFFLGQYFFNQIGQAKLKLSKDLLFQKYAGHSPQDLDNFIICDLNNNKIKVTNESFGIIHYISGDPQIRDYLVQEIMAKQERCNAVEQIKREELYSLL